MAYSGTKLIRNNSTDILKRIERENTPATPTILPTTAATLTVQQLSEQEPLFPSMSPEECIIWQSLIEKERYAELVTAVRGSTVDPVRQLPMIITDTVQLAAVIEEVLCADSQ